MNKNILERAERILGKYKRWKRWKKIASLIACVVVFCTTYALILPAITLEKDAMCGMEEHPQHSVSAGCYEVTQKLVCDQEEDELHVHDEACYSTEEKLICTKENHSHTKSCYKEDNGLDENGSNPKADLEKKGDWVKTLKKVKLTREWDKDLLTIAQTQLGYKESTKNFDVDSEGNQNGYTRYGQWYGEKYGEWSAKFVAFCLNYAKIDEKVMPEEANPQKWINEIIKNKKYKDVTYVSAKDEYTPNPGDLIFFNKYNTKVDKERIADHMGIVKELITDKNDKILEIKVIEGDARDQDDKVDQVAELIYPIDDKEIIGYVALPENPKMVTEEATEEVTTEETTEEVTTEEVTTEEAVTEETTEEAVTEETTEETVEEETTETTEGIHKKVYEGSDYTVTVTYTDEAQIPDDAELIAQEYDKNSETYKERYKEALDMYEWFGKEDYTDTFRLFNIGFWQREGILGMLNLTKKEVEPKAEVQVVITYKNQPTLPENGYQITHFGDEKNKKINAESSQIDGNATIEFRTDGFSDYGVMPLAADDIMLLAAGDSQYHVCSDHEIAHVSLDGRSGWQWRENTTDDTGKATYRNRTSSTNNNALANGAANVAPVKPIAGNIYPISAKMVATEKDYLTIAGNPNTTNLIKGKNYTEFAFDFWMEPTAKGSTDTADFGLFEIGSYYNSSYRQTLTAQMPKNGNNPKEIVLAAPGNKSITIALSENIINQWTHVYVTYSGTEATLWVENADGKVIGKGTLNTGLTVAGLFNQYSYERIAFANVKNTSYFNGYMDDIIFYDHALELPREEIGPDPHHPKTAVTENIKATGVGLYNVNTKGGDAAPLEGVEYTVYKSDGSVYGTYTTIDEFVLYLGVLPPGTYTIEQTAVPEGYVLVPQTKTFTVSANEDNLTQAGLFYDYYSGDSYDPSKKAEVYDYENRIYDVILSAKSGSYEKVVEPKNFNFVVDQSNSMLFPAVLTDTGAQVTLHSVSDGNAATWRSDASGNTRRLDSAINQYGLDPNKLYYIKAQEATTSTVYAIWKSADGHWYAQDAAYYAQAQAGVHHPTEARNYQYADSGTGDYTTKFKDGGECLDGVTRNGGTALSGCSDLWNDMQNLGTQNNSVSYTNGNNTIYDHYKTYTIYSGSEMNRLTYLKYAIKRMVMQLAAMDSKNQVTVTSFDSALEGCMTREVDAANPQSVQDLVNFVDGIQTNGGTAQNYGIAHVLGDHATGGSKISCSGNHLNYTVDGKRADDYIVLITDGALNNKNGARVYNTDSQEADLFAGANKFKQNGKNPKLITIGLSMQDVEWGKSLLADASKGGIATDGYSFLDINADELSITLSNALIDQLIELEKVDDYANIRDYISDSFYLVDTDGMALKKGNKINLSGQKVDADASDAVGTVGHDDKGWYVEWKNQTLGDGTEGTPGSSPIWHGKIYVKAKEDFIGGNTIDTNKTFVSDDGRKITEGAQISLLESKDSDVVRDTIGLSTPTVNVRLLPINNVHSEETVFLGDDVENLRTKIEALWNQIRFEKLTSVKDKEIENNGDTVHNKADASKTSGLETDTFSPGYAIGDALTKEQWDKLFAGEIEKITVPYRYDNGSSHGDVGYFTISLTKQIKEGENEGYTNHKSSLAGEEVEKYTLTLDYTAYTIINVSDEEDIPEGTVFRPVNVNNYGNGAGREVGGPEAGNTLEEGKGTLQSVNTHRVHVIDGEIFITKTIDESMISDEDQEFTFYLYKKNPTTGKPTGDPVRTVTVTVEAGDTKGTSHVDHLSRNQYIVKEAESTEYEVSGVRIDTDHTICDSSEMDDSLEFDIGTNEKSTGTGHNVILYNSPSPKYESSMWVDENRYVYSKPFKKSGNSGTHIEQREVETYAWPTGTIINTYTAGTEYVKLDSIADDLDAQHFNYGVLTQNPENKDDWTVTWTIWTSKEESTTTYDWPEGTLISADTSKAQYQKLTNTQSYYDNNHTSYGILKKNGSGNWVIEWHTWNQTSGSSSGGDNVTITFFDWRYGSATGKTITVPKNQPVTITYTIDNANTNPGYWTNGEGYSWQAIELSKTKVSGTTNRYTTTFTPTENTWFCYSYDDSNRASTFVSSSSAGTPTWDVTTTTADAVTSKLPTTTTTETIWSKTTSAPATADQTKIPKTTVTTEVEVPDEPTNPASPVEGVDITKLSAGHGEISNRPTTFTVEIPVEKRWDDHVEQSSKTAVYVVLTKDGEIIKENGFARALKLDSSNNWKGTFTVISKDPIVLSDHYSVKELSNVEAYDADGEYTSGDNAVIENAGLTPVYKHYEDAKSEGLVNVGEACFTVQITQTTSTTDPFSLTVTNQATYRLPESGGMGTNMFTLGGLLLMSISLLFGFKRRRERERRLE